MTESATTPHQMKTNVQPSSPVKAMPAMSPGASKTPAVPVNNAQMPQATGPGTSLTPQTAIPGTHVSPKALPMHQSNMPAMQGGQQTLLLEDIHLPPEPSAWPPAPGWWLVLALLLLAAALIPAKGYRYRKKLRQRQRVLDALVSLQSDLQHQGDNTALANINRLLRQLALMYYPRERVASLTGKQWLAFLDKSGETNEFTQGAGQLLADAPYRASLADSADIEGLSTTVKHWVEKILKEVKA